MKLKSIYYIFILIFVSCSNKEPIAIENLMTSFRIEKENNIGLGKTIIFELDSANRTFAYSTQKWIEGIEQLVPTFEAKGKVTMADIEQISKISCVNFSKRKLLYTITAENGAKQNFTVIMESPQTTGLPVVKIDVNNNAEITDRDTYLNATIQIHDSNNPTNNIDTLTQIRGRGNSTWWFAKKPYRIKLCTKKPLFGMQSAKSWVLLANYLDPTLLTNTIALEIARRMDMEYTNHTQHVELFLNHSYKGNYVFTEQLQVKKNRINIDTLNGGFLLELDQNYDAEYQFTTNGYHLPVMLKAPQNAQTLTEVQELMEQLENALLADSFTSDDYSKYIDVKSLINFLLLNEIVKNGEVGHPKSVYAYRKNKDAKLCFGPVWDFDWAYGYTGKNFHYFSDPNILLFGKRSNTKDAMRFFCRFFKDTTFENNYYAQWIKIEPQIADITQYVQNMGNSIAYSQIENAKIWPPKNTDYSVLIDEMCLFLNTRINFLNRVFQQ